jgi:hypothetical protein
MCKNCSNGKDGTPGLPGGDVCILLSNDSKEGFLNPKDEFSVVSCVDGKILFEGTLNDCKNKYPDYLKNK